MPSSSPRRRFIKSAVLTGIATAIAPLIGSAHESWSEITDPKEKDLVFLFQGDSITDGKRGRSEDLNHIMGHGYVFGVASRIGADFPEAGFKFYNRGISGNKLADLEKRWQTDTMDLKPDVLSVLIGINDVAAVAENQPVLMDASTFEIALRKLLQQVKMANPDVLMVLGIPFVYPVGSKRKENWDLWKRETAAREAKVRILAAEFNAVIVDYPAMFEKAMKRATPEYWVWDGIHPTICGHELMAREWIKQVSSRLKMLKKYKY
jgi:lysophospholipase L1-like esterase